MKEKNKFSILLEQLMTKTGVKNYVLAQSLQYDVSYISKWLGGHILPAEKNAVNVLQGISKCLVSSCDEECRTKLCQDYQVENEIELQEAIYDNLITAYTYAKDMDNNKDAGEEVKTNYYPKLTLQQFSVKMNHPVLRNVKSLDIVTAMDIFAMEHEHRLVLTKLESKFLPIRGEYMNVHYTMLVNLDAENMDYIYDSFFLINMLANLTHIDFQLYGGKKAAGRIIFAVKDSYSITGMLFDRNQVLAVNTSENEKICNTLYHEVKSCCSREMLLFRKTTMQEMVTKNDYIRLLISRNVRMLLGKLIEGCIPERVFYEILDHVYDEEKWNINREKLISVQKLSHSIIEESPMRIMVYESVFMDFVVSGEIDFYNRKVVLDAEQRLQCMEYFLHLLEKNEKLEIKLIHGRFIPDFQYDSRSCLLLSDTINYLRLPNIKHQNNIVVMNQGAVSTMFERFYEKIWDYGPGTVVLDKNKVIEAIRYAAQSVRVLSKIEE